MARNTRTPTQESAVAQTLARVSIEQDPTGGHPWTARLSADWIGNTDQGQAIISVINLDTREHWHLIVQPV